MEDLAKRIAAGGGSAEVFEVDVSDESAAQGLLEGTKEKLGGVDILVNNAGVMLLGPVQGADTEHWRRMVDVNCLGLLYCTHAAMPLMQERGGGHIVNVASVAGRHAGLGSAV
jgi:NADP-dependent 3-hydroxy acid dehydrogenase YdfG